MKLSKMKKPNAFLLKISMVLIVLGLVTFRLEWAVVEAPYYLMFAPSKFDSWLRVCAVPLALLALLAGPLGAYEEGEISPMSRWVARPLLVLSAVCLLVGVLYTADALFQIASFDERRYETVSLSFEQVCDLQQSGAAAVLYAGSTTDLSGESAWAVFQSAAANLPVQTAVYDTDGATQSELTQLQSLLEFQYGITAFPAVVAVPGRNQTGVLQGDAEIAAYLFAVLGDNMAAGIRYGPRQLQLLGGAQ